MTAVLVSLRASPASGIGGMYATGKGPGNAVKVEAARPPAAENQKWILEPLPHGGADTSKVQVRWANDRSLAWTIQDTENIENSKIILESGGSERITVWNKKPHPVPGHADAFTLSADHRLFGADWYAGTNEENEVVIKVIIPGPHSEEPPYWVPSTHEA